MKTTMKLRILIGIILTGGLVGLSSCLDDGWDINRISDEFVLSPGVATPIAFGELSLKDLLTELDTGNYVEVYDDSLLYISYGQELFSYPAEDIIEVPDQEFNEIYINSDITDLPEWLDTDQDTVRASKRQNGDFKFNNNERLDSAYIKSMDLEIKVTSTFHHRGFLDLASDSVFLENGETFYNNIKISSALGNFDTTYIINISNCKIYFDVSEPGKTYLPLKTDFYIIKSGSPVNPVHPDDLCTITMSFINIEYSSAYGYFGMYDLMIDDGDITLDVFDINEIEGDISFYNPQLILTVTNSYGLPVQIELDNITTYSEIKDTTTNIIFTGANPFNIPAPGLNSVGTSVDTTIEINRTNTNIVEAIETLPRKFTYTASVITNPTGPDDSENFITDSSYIEVHAEVVLPIRLRASNFAFEDTVDFDFDEQMGTSIDFIDMFALEMDVRNGLPMEVGMQLFFKDSAYTTLDSMFVDDAFLLAPNLDAQDRVVEPIEYTKKVEFDAERIEKIKTTKYMFVRATINTAGAGDGDYVKFFDYYNIYFKLKMETALTINSRDL